MVHWYAFQSKARKEKFLCEQLRIRNIETFFPCIRTRSGNSRHERVQPYFPGYVFGRVDLEKSGRSLIDWMPGVVQIVNYGGEPVSIQDYLINVLRQHLDAINSSGEDLCNKFHPGDLVTIHGGPFAGYEGIFNACLPGRDRVEVLLMMLQGTQLRVELSVNQISLLKELDSAGT